MVDLFGVHMTLIQEMIKLGKQQQFNTDEYFNRMKNGDASARNDIILQWIGLVVKIASKFKPVDGFTDEDYFSLGLEGLIKAVDTYNVTKGVKFVTYASRCIANEIMLKSRTNKHFGFVSYDGVVFHSQDGNKKVLYLDLLADRRTELLFAQIENEEASKKLHQFLKDALTKEEYMIVGLKFGFFDGKERTLRDIEPIVGKSRTTVGKILNRALKKIRQWAQENNVYSVTEC